MTVTLVIGVLGLLVNAAGVLLVMLESRYRRRVVRTADSYTAALGTNTPLRGPERRGQSGKRHGWRQQRRGYSR
jgi:hypothetical protein